MPVVAVTTDVEEGGTGLTVETSTDMAVVTLTGPDGRRALPVFTGTAALAAWDPTARPVPVTADRAAQAAVAEGCDVMVVDLAGGGGAPATELRPSQVWALAQRRAWLPAHEDPFVRAAVEGAVRPEDAVEHVDVEDGDPRRQRHPARRPRPAPRPRPGRRGRAGDPGGGAPGRRR